MISINSNGSLIQDDMLEFLAADPPSRVNITLYGASPETYGALCGNPDVYFKTVRAIENLQSAGITGRMPRQYTFLPRSTDCRFRQPAICSRRFGPVSMGRFAPIAFHRFRRRRKRCAMIARGLLRKN